MRLILVRHGKRERSRDREDRDQELSADGAADIDKLIVVLRALGIAPTACYSSEYLHARVTAELLRDALAGPTVDIVTLPCLTPHSNSEGILAFLAQARAERFHKDDVILIVGHEPRLAQLVGAMTSTRSAPLPRASALAVKASTYRHLLAGR